MLAYDLNNILQIVPEAVGMVKEASLSEDFPTDSKDSTLASGLQIAYLTKVAGEIVDYVIQDKVSRAAIAYGISDELEKLAALPSVWLRRKRLCITLRRACGCKRKYCVAVLAFTKI